MKSQYRWIPSLCVFLCLPTLTLACLWDYDTLKQERARFPSTLELITGKFLRHSKDFYLWRIDDRLNKLKTDPSNVNYYDDLAVAYEKTGQHAKAIETILAKDKIKPGLYETYSNLGTFYILAGEFEKGLPYIDKALAINPDAHFGREKYQKWLVEYALSRRVNGTIRFPLHLDQTRTVGIDKSIYSFSDYLRSKLGKKHFDASDIPQAINGILGMMRFANHDNPLLLEALGDLLIASHENETDAKRLAGRAYLKASYAVTYEEDRDFYRALVRVAISLQATDPNNRTQLSVDALEAEFKKQLADADLWYAELAHREATWIREGKDVDAEFDKFYLSEPQALGERSDDVWSWPLNVRINIYLGLLILGIVTFIVMIWLLIRRIRHRGQSKQEVSG